MPPSAIPPRDVEDATLALTRVEPDIETQDPNDLSPMNVNIIEATSVVLGVVDGILSYKAQLLKLPDFDVAHVDKLSDYAKATWLIYITSLPSPEASEVDAMIAELTALRAKLFRYAEPLAEDGYLSLKAVKHYREGTGTKDIASDVVGLVTMFRSAWPSVKDLCAVTEADLERGAKIGPAVFIWASRRDNDPSVPAVDASLRLKKAWTRLDRAYDQCRRGIAFIRWSEGDANTIAPSLRSNPGPRAKKPEETQPIPEAPTAPPAGPAGTPIGGGEAPFA